MLVKFFSFGMVAYNGGGFWVKYIVKLKKNNKCYFELNIVNW